MACGLVGWGRRTVVVGDAEEAADPHGVAVDGHAGEGRGVRGAGARVHLLGEGVQGRMPSAHDRTLCFAVGGNMEAVVPA